jgi:hypothetical protein
MIFEKYLRKAYRMVTPSRSKVEEQAKRKRLASYLKNGRVPWSEGYHDYKWDEIEKAITSADIIQKFKNSKIQSFGLGIDERIIEYPWIFSALSDSAGRLLDAGSTFNFKTILDQPIIKKKELSIYTYYPEHRSFNENRISYLYGDLRLLPFRDNWFEEIVCHSTIEHIDMDNSMYGYELKGNPEPKDKSYKYLEVVNELVRVLKGNGKLLITFPFGRFENHGFFQQFDGEMLRKITEVMHSKGSYSLTFFRYFREGWKIVPQAECESLESYNPHTGIGKGEDGAAHSRGICCIHFIKS